MTAAGPAGQLSPPEVFGGFEGGVPDALGLAQPGTIGIVARLTAAEVRDRTPARLDGGATGARPWKKSSLSAAKSA
ncbi:hypothetical protein ABT404_03150 [Streptomyces hyaluromycini]|uniref:Uncharacterized protein n=1 Tax=Streptomyces hyaluromycini TaxID=1377993 RepID=A0ABV1WNN4_9ACTN